MSHILHSFLTSPIILPDSYCELPTATATPTLSPMVFVLLKMLLPLFDALCASFSVEKHQLISIQILLTLYHKTVSSAEVGTPCCDLTTALPYTTQYFSLSQTVLVLVSYIPANTAGRQHQAHIPHSTNVYYVFSLSHQLVCVCVSLNQRVLEMGQ